MYDLYNSGRTLQFITVIRGNLKASNQSINDNLSYLMNTFIKAFWVIETYWTVDYHATIQISKRAKERPLPISQLG